MRRTQSPVEKTKFLAIALTAALALSACGESPEKKMTTTGSQSDPSLLENTQFGMTLDAPDSWYIADDAQMREMMNIGKDIAAGDQDDLKAVMDASIHRNIPLFAVFEHAPGAPVDVNPSVMAIAENVSAAPGVKSGKDYFFNAKKLMSQTTAQYAYEDEYRTREFGEVSFDQMDLTITVAGQTVSQSYYAAKNGDYIVLVIVSPNNSTTSAVLENLKFSW